MVKNKVTVAINEALKDQFSLLYERSRKSNISNKKLTSLAVVSNAMVNLTKEIQKYEI